MKSKPNIDQLVEDTLDSVSSIDRVKAPPFFKDKVLSRMGAQGAESASEVRLLDWFTPRYQAAALVCFVILNAFALLSNTTNNDYSDNVENFAEVYGLSETSTDAYLYQN